VEDEAEVTARAEDEAEVTARAEDENDVTEDDKVEVVARKTPNFPGGTGCIVRW
jgi:hypothetical protein